MRTLVTADLHLSANPRDRYRHIILRRLVKQAAELGVTQTFILGDLTEEKDRHSDWLTNKVVDHVKRFAELGPVYIDQGNHDYSSDPDMPFFHFLRHLPGVRWIGKPTAFSADGLGRVLFLPHTRDFKKEWKGIPFDDYAFIFAHGTFERTRLGHGRTVEAGIPPEVFPRSARVVSGDVHIPQAVGQITYVGAPYTIDFGDDYAARVLILDGGDQVRDGVSKGGFVKWKRTPVKVKSVPVLGPQKRLVDFGASDQSVLNAGDILKIRVEIKRSKAAEWPKRRDEARAWALKAGYKVHAIQPVIVEDKTSKAKIRRAEIKSDQQVMKEFAQHRGIDERMRTYGERFL
jgi:hypothetical protein